MPDVGGGKRKREKDIGSFQSKWICNNFLKDLRREGTSRKRGRNL